MVTYFLCFWMKNEQDLNERRKRINNNHILILLQDSIYRYIYGEYLRGVSVYNCTVFFFVGSNDAKLFFKNTKFFEKKNWINTPITPFSPVTDARALIFYLGFCKLAKIENELWEKWNILKIACWNYVFVFYCFYVSLITPYDNIPVQW